MLPTAKKVAKSIIRQDFKKNILILKYMSVQYNYFDNLTSASLFNDSSITISIEDIFEPKNFIVSLFGPGNVNVNLPSAEELVAGYKKYNGQCFVNDFYTFLVIQNFPATTFTFVPGSGTVFPGNVLTSLANSTIKLKIIFTNVSEGLEACDIYMSPGI
jgi:hypothetical protein